MARGITPASADRSMTTKGRGQAPPLHPEGAVRLRRNMRNPARFAAIALLVLGGCSTQPHAAAPPSPAAQAFDVVIRGGTVYDGSGGPGRVADVGLRGDRIVAVGDLGA